MSSAADKMDEAIERVEAAGARVAVCPPDETQSKTADAIREVADALRTLRDYYFPARKGPNTKRSR